MKPFLVFDLETTGLSAAKGDAMVEIAAVKIEGGRVTGSFSSLVNPGRSIPWYSTKIHGITDRMVMDAPSISKVLGDFYDFAGESVYVAHNASFDISFLRLHNRQHRFGELSCSVLCTKLLSRSLFPYARKHGLDQVAIREGILCELFDRHRAMGDVEILSRVFMKWLRLYPEEVRAAIGNLQLTSSP